MRGLRTLVRAGVASLALSTQAPAADIFVYERADGSKLITDHPRIEPGYSLVRVYGSDAAHGAPEPTTGVGRPGKIGATSFDGLIRHVSDSVTLDPALIKSVVHAESAFDPLAVSSKGASGLMQLMPATARRYGVTRIFDPRENVMAGSRYLRDLLSQFDGDMRLALAGYNAGENAVVKHGGVPPYAETRRYVDKVLGLYARYRKLQCGDAPDGATTISCGGTSAAVSSGWTVIQ